MNQSVVSILWQQLLTLTKKRAPKGEILFILILTKLLIKLILVKGTVYILEKIFLLFIYFGKESISQWRIQSLFANCFASMEETLP